MNGWIKLTLYTGEKLYVNPLQISVFTKATPDITGLAGCSPHPGATSVFVAGMMFQVKESEREIAQISRALMDKLADRQQENVIRLRERLREDDREPWQD